MGGIPVLSIQVITKGTKNSPTFKTKTTIFDIKYCIEGIFRGLNIWKNACFSFLPNYSKISNKNNSKNHQRILWIHNEDICNCFLCEKRFIECNWQIFTTKCFGLIFKGDKMLNIYSILLRFVKFLGNSINFVTIEETPTRISTNYQRCNKCTFYTWYCAL